MSEYVAQYLISKLSKSAQEIVRGNVPPGKYRTPRDADHSLVAAMVRSELTIDQAKYVFSLTKHESYYRDLLASDPVRGEHLLTTDYEDSKVAIKTALALFKWVMNTPERWKGRKGRNDKYVLLAHIARCEMAARMRYHLSIRDMAMMARITIEAAWRCKQRLKKEHLVNEIFTGWGTNASIYKLGKSPKATSRDDGFELFSDKRLIRLFKLYNLDSFGIFRERHGLGKSAYEVWLILCNGPLPQKEVARLSGLSKSTVSRAMHKLKTYQLIHMIKQRGYSAVTDRTVLRSVAHKLNAEGADLKQHQQAVRDRHRYAQWLKDRDSSRGH